MPDLETARGMKTLCLAPFIAAAIILVLLLVYPRGDLVVSGWFYLPGGGFVFADNPFFLFIHQLAYWGARALGFFLTAMIVICLLRRRALGRIDLKKWIFLLLALVIGPGLIANAGLKDHWGRARPREITEFAGSAAFSPAWLPQQNPRKNESFVAGDAAFGFYLPCFAYAVPLPNKPQKKQSSRRVFWLGILLGALFGFVRIAMGAHFLSDVLCAGFFMLASCFVLHVTMFGKSLTAIYWRNWFFRDAKKAVT